MNKIADEVEDYKGNIKELVENLTGTRCEVPLPPGKAEE